MNISQCILSIGRCESDPESGAIRLASVSLRRGEFWLPIGEFWKIRRNRGKPSFAAMRHVTQEDLGTLGTPRWLPAKKGTLSSSFYSVLFSSSFVNEEEQMNFNFKSPWELVEASGDAAVAKSAVSRWAAWFREGYSIRINDPVLNQLCTGADSTSTVIGGTTLVDDWRFSLEELRFECDLSHASAHNIFMNLWV